MKLQDLVLEARRNNKGFDKLIKSRMLIKNHPSLAFIIQKLEKILGREYVIAAARKEIKAQRQGLHQSD